MLRLMLSIATATVVLSLAAAVSPELSRAQAPNTVKIGMLAPRGSALDNQLKKISEKLSRLTNNQWEFRIYPSGVAGDEKDVIRKMQVGQLDSVIVTTTGLSLVDPQLAVLDAPGVINTYGEMDAVVNDLYPEISSILAKKKITLLRFYAAGAYRLFCRGYAYTKQEIQTKRWWLWPESYILKEIWREFGTTAVPLSVPDVYAAIQTKIIDCIISTPVAVVSMRWHTGMDHVSAGYSGVMMFGWVVNADKWNAIPEKARLAVEEEIKILEKDASAVSRKLDDEAFNKLLQRGYTTMKMTPESDRDWTAMYEAVNKRLTGRLWPAALLNRVKAVVAKNKGKP